MKTISYVDNQHLYIRCIQPQPLPPFLQRNKENNRLKFGKSQWNTPILHGQDQNSNGNTLQSVTFNRISLDDLELLIEALQVAKEKYKKHLVETK